jgi:protein-arginine kinase
MDIISPDIFKGNIIMTRVRLARNIKGFPFKVTNPELARETVKMVNRALVRTDTFNLYYMANLYLVN